MNETSVGLEWKKSSASNTGNCVEVAVAGEAVLVRNTRNRDGGCLAFTVSEWEAFILGVGGGEFTLGALAGKNGG